MPEFPADWCPFATNFSAGLFAPQQISKAAPEGRPLLIKSEWILHVAGYLFQGFDQFIIESPVVLLLEQIVEADP